MLRCNKYIKILTLSLVKVHRRMKAMIFTTDAIFALVIVGAALSIIVYFNFAVQTPYSLSGLQAQTLLATLSSTSTASLGNASLIPCYPSSNASILQTAVQLYMSGAGSCATYLLNSLYPMTNYGLFLNGNYAPSLNVSSYNGLSSYIDIGSSPNLNLVGPFTLSAWINPKYPPNGYGSYGQVIAKTNSGGSGGYEFGWLGSASCSTLYMTNGPGTINSNKSICTGVWSYIAITFDGTNSIFYINGVKQGTSSTLTYPSSTQDTGIGRAPARTLLPFNGLIADVQIYNTALSSAQIATLYAGGIAGPTLGTAAGNIGWWPLEGDARDYSGYNDTGTPTNVIYVNGNYVPNSYKGTYSVSTARLLVPFSQYQTSYPSSAIFTYNAFKLYSVGVYAWR